MVIVARVVDRDGNREAEVTERENKVKKTMMTHQKAVAVRTKDLDEVGIHVTQKALRTQLHL